MAESKFSFVFQSIRQLLWRWRYRLLVATLFMVAAKLASVAMPWALKHIVDGLAPQGVDILIVPVVFILLYGGLRFAMTAFNEIRDTLFARVTEQAMRQSSLQVFDHLHKLDLGFHLSRQTGALARDMDRGASALSSLVRFFTFSIAPTLIELVLVVCILIAAFDWRYGAVTGLGVLSYVLFTAIVTEWRTRYVRQANQLDSDASARAVDSLINYETVKYFNAEQYESTRLDAALASWETARLKTRSSLAILNGGQALIISIAATIMLWMAGHDVASGRITVGDLTMINAYLLQLFIPLGFLGTVYREIRRSFTDLDKYFGLLRISGQIQDADDAQTLTQVKGDIQFHNVDFAYHADRQILHKLNLTIQAGQRVALVGGSGAGKSTIARLLFRFYDVQSGSITLDGTDIRAIKQEDLRQQIAVVPQDTVLFNDTLAANIRYGSVNATEDEMAQAIAMANLAELVEKLPEGLQTMVGERGLKLSGGEKQRVAIARAILKRPRILIFDEATSALDSHSEKLIVDAMHKVTEGRTAVIVAHRLSTIADADNILVLDEGRLVEQGTHAQLLSKNGKYAQLWQLQSR
ncbi:ABCB family ABC transporter ATP-binding protein/permease [Salinibius halmophilus]|uniref:ABCB family ABC transporter ATP-binding protein/permease n=1 Tax=Salinibius halmophilus TaxID=1853216 RepID=UPI000E66418A|nr:ABC transporter ATP-binding protein/permease [Salinibius halmophilus]